ncbi:hypothetical protein [Caulobacter radicis]|nr:hypothetical protein [Caulobacter radicis]
MTLKAKLDELRALAPDAFSIDAIEGAERALADADNPLRLNFFSAAMRILSEHSLERMAPDDQVKDCVWFSPEQDNGNPTRSQRVKFAIQGGLTDELVREQLKIEVRPLERVVSAAFKELSKQVHARENTIVTDCDEQDAQAGELLDSLLEFFIAVEDAKASILKPIRDELDDAAIDALLSETLLDVDELASHYSLDEVYVEEVVVARIEASTITYLATGSIAVTLQWGSNSDLRRGDGAELNESFPFTCEITVGLDDMWALDNVETNYGVDTSSWTDVRYGQDEDDF